MTLPHDLMPHELMTRAYPCENDYRPHHTTLSVYIISGTKSCLLHSLSSLHESLLHKAHTEELPNTSTCTIEHYLSLSNPLGIEC